MKTGKEEILEDIVANYPGLVSYYEQRMQVYYREMMSSNTPDSIPRSQIKALLVMLDACGYSVNKRPELKSVPNIIKLGGK